MSALVRLVALLALSASSIFALTIAQHQNVDPAYLRQYYQQLQQQQQHQSADATPIYEQNSEQTQQYVPSGQQLRLKDTVREQVQHQQQQQQQQVGGYVAPAVREYLQHQPQVQQVQYQSQHQPQQVAYRNQAPATRHQQPQYQAQAAPKSRLTQQQQQQQQEEEEYDDQNSSYQFGFDVKDDEFTNYQNRKEVRDGSVIKGSYSVVDSDGFIRTVKYTADPKEGFKAEVIREPTDIVVKVPTPAPQTLLRQTHKSQDYALKQQYHAQPQQQQQQQYHQYQQ